MIIGKINTVVHREGLQQHIHNLIKVSLNQYNVLSNDKVKPINQENNMTAKVEIEISIGNKCDLCTGALCCQYITHEIDTPRKKIDFEYLLWQVSHEHIHIYKDEDGWYLLVMSPCTHLIPDSGRCGIYDKRPQICRDHTNDFCEYDQPNEEGFELYFKDYSSMHRYCKKRFKKWLR